MARHHLEEILDGDPDTKVVAICEPSAAAYGAAAQLFDQHGLPVPPNEPDWVRFVARYSGQLDAAFIITPHVLHFEQATACLEAGLDVLLEKPMVMTADEARALIETRDRTGRLLVVAFQGSLSPHVREAARMLRSGELGPILNISAVAWQDWATLTEGTWRQQPELSGGGFLFDTGAHMLNTVSDLAGEDFADVAAWLEDDGRPVDIRAAVMGRLVSGALVTMNAVGSAIPSCHSDIRVFTSKAILRTGIWGERLELQRAGAARLRRVSSVAPMQIWDQFLNVRVGTHRQPEPARSRAADGSPLGRDPQIDRARRRRHLSAALGARRTRGARGTGRTEPRRGPPSVTRVTVWNEFRQELSDPAVGTVYPDGIHGAVGDGLRAAGFDVRTATLDEPEHGLTDDVLAATDVLTWWGHVAHDEVADAVVDRVHRRVLDGMGLIVLHSGHFSRIFKRLMGTSCDLTWREAGERERVWVVDRSHPIAEGLGESFVIDEEEMYGEPFDIPAPDRLVLIGWFQGGEVFRSGCCYQRGRGRIFYFQPGHETHPTYFNPDVRTVIANAARWATQPLGAAPVYGNRQSPPEQL